MRMAIGGVFLATGLLVLGGCSPGEVVQVEWDPAPTSASVAVDTSVPEPTLLPESAASLEATVEPEPTLLPESAASPEATVEPEASLVPESAASPEATVEPEATLVPEPTLAPEATVEPVATAVPEPTLAPLATAVPAAPAPTEPALSPTAPPAPSSDSQAVRVANGAEVYTLNCARCHAESGLGTAQYGGLLGVGSRYSSAGMISELTDRHPVTFGFADKLSADEIASVVAYVKATFP